MLMIFKFNNHLITLLSISFPIFLQSMLFSSRNLVDVLLLGGLGDDEVAAMGAACRYLILSTVVMFAVAKSSSQKMARRYGQGNFECLKNEFINLVSVIMPLSITISAIFFVFPEHLISISSNNETVIELGSIYLRIVSFQLVFTSFVIALSLALRIVHKPKISTVFSAVNIGINVVLTYVLVSGVFFESWGIFGAAISTLLSSLIEFFAIFLHINNKKKEYPFYVDVRDMKQYFSICEALSLFRFSLPMMISGFLYSFAMFAYVAIFGRVGEAEQAAISIMFSLESILMGLAVGISQGAGVLIGGSIGKKNFREMKQVIHVTFWVGFAVLIFSSISIFFSKDFILMFFTGLSMEAVLLTKSMLIFVSLTIFLRGASVILYNGILRAGGDNQFCMKVDLISIWLFVVPFIFMLSGKVEPLALFLLLYLEDVIKILLGMKRLRTNSWIKKI